MKNLKLRIVIFNLLFLLIRQNLFSQESLKSVEEEYYDFLSLQQITERPTINYRTLSDSEWYFLEQKDKTESINLDFENSTETELSEKSVRIQPWQNIFLGKKFIFWQNKKSYLNWFERGLNQKIALKIYGPEWFNSYNTAEPYGQNDGALWQGKGYNSSLTAGIRFEALGFELTLKPQLSFSQNKEFAFLQGVYGNENSYFWAGNIDLVQRYGDSAFWNFDWGDSEIRWSWNSFTVGFGTQSMWLGPAWLNPMLGSNNAGGYPKFDIGLRKQKVVIPFLNWNLGEIEGRVWLGQLTESKYFDNDDSNNKRLISGISAAYAPSFIPGFSIGLNRIFLAKRKSASLKYFARLFTLGMYQNDTTGDGEDQKVSLFVRQVIPQFGFEVYGELGIDDFTSEKLANPFHTAIYTIGAKKTFDISQKYNIAGELIFEWNNFEMSQDFQLQWKYMGYYSHGKIFQGYTQNGQILGAGSGYAGNSQYLGFKVYFPKASVMPYYHRSCPDNNYIFSKAVYDDASADADTAGKNSINTDYYAVYKTYSSFGIQADYFVTKAFRLGAEFVYTKIIYPTYTKPQDSLNNFRFCIQAKYNF